MEMALLWVVYRGRYMHMHSHEGRVGIDFMYRPITDISPLRFCRLLHLGLYGTKITNWPVLRKLDFVELNVGGTDFSDTELLRGKPLRRLEMGGTPVTSLEPLRGMPLFLLQIGGTAVRDFSPVASLPLDVLLMHDCHCDDLSFLQGTNLQYFGFTFTPGTKGLEHLMAMSRLENISTSAYDSFTPDEFYRRHTRGLPLDEEARRYAKMRGEEAQP